MTGVDTHPSFVIAMGVVFLVLCPIAVVLRFYARHKQHAGFKIDDWLTLPALLLVIGCAVNIIVGIALKAYAHPTHVTATEVPDYSLIQKLACAFILMQVLSIGLVKLSSIFLFRRIFVKGRPKHVANAASIIVLTIIVAWTVTFIFWPLFACGTHFSKRWGSLVEAHIFCPTDKMNGLALASSDVITDVIVLALPIPSVLRLHMSTNRKLALLGVFGLGTLSLVASVIRLVIFVHTTNSATNRTAGQMIDIKLVMTEGVYWPMLENGLALIACCLPVLNSLIKSNVPSIGSARSITRISIRPRKSQGSEGNASPTFADECDTKV